MEQNYKKQICFICVSGLPIPPVKGGAIETLVYELVQENEKMCNYLFTVVTTEDNKLKDFHLNYTKFHRIANKKWLNRICRRLNFLGRKLRLVKNDFVPLEKKEAAHWLVKKWQEFDLIIEENGMEVFKEIGDSIPINKKVFHIHGISEYNFENANQVGWAIAVSSYIARTWISSSGFAKNRINILYNCIDLDKFRPNYENLEIKKTYGIREDDFVIFFSGRIIPEKGILELIKAVNLLEDENIVLLIAGDLHYGYSQQQREYTTLLQKLAKQSKSEIVFLGYIDNELLRNYHCISNVVAIPSICEEAFCLVVLEAQASGRAIVATRNGGIPEILPPECGIIVDNDKNIVENFSKAIKYLKDNTDICRSMGQAGTIHASKYSKENYYIKFCEIIGKITH